MKGSGKGTKGQPQGKCYKWQPGAYRTRTPPYIGITDKPAPDAASRVTLINVVTRKDACIRHVREIGQLLKVCWNSAPTSQCCKCCGKAGHPKHQCTLQDNNYGFCGSIGHTEAMCKKKLAKDVAKTTDASLSTIKGPQH